MNRMSGNTVFYAWRVSVHFALSLFLISCSKGTSISSAGGPPSFDGTLTLSLVYPSSAGSSWTPIKTGNRFIIKGLDLTVTGSCTRGIATIKVNEGGANYPEQAACASDGTFTFAKTYAAGAGEGDKTLNFTSYDASGSQITNAVQTSQVRIDNTPPSVPSIALPASTPYSHTGPVGSYTISGLVSVPDCDHLTGPSGVTITPNLTTGAWSYVAALTSGASLNFTFYAWDLAGNQSAGTTQTILWSPAVDISSGGVINGGQFTSVGGQQIEFSQYAKPGSYTDVGTTHDILTGFNFIINKPRGL